MPIASVDWAIFISVVLTIMFLMLSEESVFFEILAALVILGLAVLLYEAVLWGAAVPVFARWTLTAVMVTAAILLFAHGAMGISSEARR
ncbi:MAG: hypothetical protein A3K59_00175 [Euryarchaeota archaeon RBG_19FT_COMBO_69_17]|nr:MAG: hypothetical protein A3K59_00175 [Euryarchaeota archaeon RBG_19FT_COMBO_69_17]